MKDFAPNRRQFLQLAGLVAISAGLPVPARLEPRQNPLLTFPQGIASGDPGTQSVILWTRAESPASGDIKLVVQLSETDSFETLIVESEVKARASHDHTVRAEISGLSPGRHYFYRFVGIEGGLSPVGRTMTAPEEEDPRKINLAFASCQNYEQGYFGAWSRMVSEDLTRNENDQIHFVLHLGDFIYERYGYEERKGQRYVRKFPDYPDSDSEGYFYWADSLADYRHLYKTYLSDPHLQAARARWPFICTWDDHEFSNNGAGDYSTYGPTPKQQTARKHSANKAWFEYIPAQVEDTPEDFHIYRQLRWGKNVDLLVTDLRSYRSLPSVPHGITKELGLPTTPSELVKIFDAGKTYNDGNPPQTLPFGDGSVANPAREREPASMLGANQKQWFKDKLKTSDGTWRVWGNALPILALRMDLGNLPLMGMENSVLGTDAWSGFPTEYQELLGFIADEEISNFVSLSGDHHCQAAGRLALDVDAETPEFAAADFNVTGISSTPQFAGVVYTGESDNPDFMQLVAKDEGNTRKESWNMTLTQGALATMVYGATGVEAVAGWLGPNKANPGTVYMDSNSNGYGLASFDAEACKVQLVTVTAPVEESDNQGQPIQHIANFRLPVWSKNEQPRLEGPEFEGPAPFPYG